MKLEYRDLIERAIAEALSNMIDGDFIRAVIGEIQEITEMNGDSAWDIVNEATASEWQVIVKKRSDK